MSELLPWAGIFPVAGIVLTRLFFADHPVARFVCQFTTFAGFTVMLVIAGVTPSVPTPAMGHTFTYFLISVFKIAWWLTASWLLTGFARAALVFKRQPRETRFLQDLIAGFLYIGAVNGGRIPGQGGGVKAGQWW